MNSEVMQKGLGVRTVAVIALALILVAGALVATGRSHATQATGVLTESHYLQTACSAIASCEGAATGAGRVSIAESVVYPATVAGAGIENATIGRQSSVLGTTSTYTPSSTDAHPAIAVASVLGDAVTVTVAAGGVTGNDPETWVTATPHQLAVGDTFELIGAIATGGGSCTAGLGAGVDSAVATIVSATSFTTAATAANCAAGTSTATTIGHGANITTSAAHNFTAGQQVCFDAAITAVTAPANAIDGDQGPGGGAFPGDLGADCGVVSAVLSTTAFSMTGFVVNTAQTTAAGNAHGLVETGTLTVTVTGSCGIGALAGGPSVTLAQAQSSGTVGTYADAVFFSQGIDGTCEIDTIGNTNGTAGTNNQIQMVGGAASISLADPQTANARVTQGAAPLAGAVASANKAATTTLLNSLTGNILVAREFMFYATDANSQPVLDTTGGTFTTTGGAFANGLTTQPVTSFDAQATNAAGCVLGTTCYSGASPAGATGSNFGPNNTGGTTIPVGNWGWFWTSITAASLATGKTANVTLTSNTNTASVDFTTFGAGSTIAVTAPALAGAGGAVLSPNAAGVNVYGAWGIQVDDVNGVGVTGLAAAGNLSVGNNAANVGAMVFGTAANGGVAQAPDVAPVATAAVAGVAGAYTAYMGTNALTAAGTYKVDVTVFLGGVLGSLTETVDVVVGGAAANVASTIGSSQLDAGESTTITFTFTDANGNSVPDGSAVSVGSTGGVVLPAAPYATTGGAISLTYAAPTATTAGGQQTVTAQQGTIVKSLAITVGEVAAPASSTLSLVSGGQFVHATWNGAADSTFGSNASVTIVWKYNTGSGTWSSYVPALGTALTINSGDTLWIVTSEATSVSI